MKIFVLEWLNGGGLLLSDHHPDPPTSVIGQGRGMLEAICDDLVGAAFGTVGAPAVTIILS